LGIKDKSLKEIENVLAAKVFGAENLLIALKEEKIRYFAMTSSLTSLIEQ